MIVFSMPAEVRGDTVSASEAGAVAGAVDGSTEQVAAVSEAAGGSAAAPSDVAVGVADVAVSFLHFARFLLQFGCLWVFSKVS